jgi:hypothetical protein
VAHTAAALADVTCNLRVDYPHNSGHVFGTVNAVAQVACDSSMNALALYVALYRDGELVASAAVALVLVGPSPPCPMSATR